MLEEVTQRLLHYQVFAGKAAHGLQLRRPLWSTFSDFWRVFEKPWLTWKPRWLSFRARSEVLTLLSLLPLCENRFGGNVDPVVTASDASEAGLGLRTRLSDVGSSFVRELFVRDASGLGGVPQARDDWRYPVLFIILLFLPSTKYLGFLTDCRLPSWPPLWRLLRRISRRRGSISWWSRIW